MKDILSYFSIQTPQSGTEGGLPYWIFWFLLSIILLLIIFIFLRDKKMRQRLNQFLFRTKQKLVRLRLQKNLNNEKRKKTGFFHDIGETANEKKIRLPGDEKLVKKIDGLENKKADWKKEIQAINSKIDELKVNFEKAVLELDTEKAGYEEDKKQPALEKNRIKEELSEVEPIVRTFHKDLKKIEKDLSSTEKSLEELSNNKKKGVEEKVVKEKELNNTIKKLQDRKNTIDKKLPGTRQKMEKLTEQQIEIQKILLGFNDKVKDVVERKKQKSQQYHKEVKEREKNREKIQDHVKDIDNRISPLFQELGELIDKSRIDNKDLSLPYSQVDRANKRISDLEKQIKELE